MVDDKDDLPPDPWADIDAEGSDQPADGFSFSFDTSSEVEEHPAEEPTRPAVPPSAPDADDEPIIRIEAAAEPEPEADPFATLSFDSTGGGEADDVAGWLEEPEAASDEPAPVVFDASPSGDAEPPLTDFGGGLGDFGMPAPDNVHEAEADAGVGAVESSHVEVGTGFSGVVSPSEIDPVGDSVPGDDWADLGELDAEQALEAEGGPDTEAVSDDFSMDDQPSFDVSGFGGGSELAEPEDAGEPHPTPVEDLGVAAAATAVTAAGATRARKKGGGVGQLIGIVIGGLMAIPITYAILIWGFQRDPFKLAKLLPTEVAFLLPQKLQAGSRGMAAGPRLAAASALDDLPPVAEESSPAEPVEEPAPVPQPEPVPAADEKPLAVAPTDRLGDAAEPPMKAEPDEVPLEPLEPATPPPTPPRPPEDLFAEPANRPEPPPPPKPEPLDLAALDAAASEAMQAFEAVAAADPESPERKKLLVGWYKRLAVVAEQLVLLEKIAADTGRDFADAAHGIDPLCAALAADTNIQEDLAKLGGMWLASRKRLADGAVLLATFEGSRQVGPYWSSRVSVGVGEPRTVAVISRFEPQAEIGERVLVTGVLFDGDVVWASDCRDVAKKAAPVEDLF